MAIRAATDQMILRRRPGELSFCTGNCLATQGQKCVHTVLLQNTTAFLSNAYPATRIRTLNIPDASASGYMEGAGSMRSRLLVAEVEMTLVASSVTS
ncbi:MAG: hypothetical protein CVT59_04595 [Actinobacteria bacterium HGW-Actinobacteria-1]|jgi:hypothetical protein|nr:MAG: hypothetical protein CVT59_04595 [Actinobacteria bacterium HGW-Actinobacteria-1]